MARDFPSYSDAVRRHGCPPFANRVLLARVDSTNLLARRIADECLEDREDTVSAVLLAWEQTAGRGRRGNSWLSLPGKGVYGTLLLAVEETVELETLPLLTAVALAEVINGWLSERACRLKWPNDLLVGERKIGGVLCEGLIRGGRPRAAILGFGVNHGHDADELPSPAATSLRLESDRPPELARLACDLVAALGAAIAERRDPAAAIDRYRRHSIHRPGEHLACRYGGELVAGAFCGFDDRGHLVLETASGERTLPAGELIAE